MTMNTPHQREAPPHAEALTSDTTSNDGDGCGGAGERDRRDELDRHICKVLSQAQHVSRQATEVAVWILPKSAPYPVVGALFEAVHAQALAAWWGRVHQYLRLKDLPADEALVRVRAQARRCLTSEAAGQQPGTLFDHALAHAIRATAHDFLHTSAELLSEHTGQTEPHPPPAAVNRWTYGTPPPAQ